MEYSDFINKLKTHQVWYKNLIASNLESKDAPGKMELLKFNINDIDIADEFMNSVAFIDCKLTNCKFHNCDFSGAYFIRSVFVNCFFEKCMFKKTNFGDADCRGAQFVNCSFLRTDFTGANLQQVDFSFSDFNGADLINVDLRLANLDNTSFDGATIANSRIYNDKKFNIDFGKTYKVKLLQNDFSIKGDNSVIINNEAIQLLSIT